MAYIGNASAPVATTLADNSVETADIKDGAITAAKLAAGAAVPSQTGNSGKFLTTDGTTATWATVPASPIIASVSPTSFNGNAGSTITINGFNFSSGAAVDFIGNDGTVYSASSTTFVNSTQLTAVTPEDFLIANEPYGIKVTLSNGANATSTGLLDAGSTPTWSTNSGSIGSVNQGDSVNISVSASDPDGGAITYSLVSGSLPSGVSLNTSTGALTGTAPSVANDTTYSFTIRATDVGGNSTDRAFNITVISAIEVALTIAADTQNYNIWNNRGGSYSAGKTNITLTINSGIFVGSTSTGSYALSTGSGWSPGDTITIINNGKILGAGGSGGAGGSSHPYPGTNGSNGSSGGPALQLLWDTTITNNDTIAGGGGGGGGGGGSYASTGYSGGGGGGGGQGYTGGSGGSGGTSNIGNYYGQAGSSGSSASRGFGGNGGNFQGTYFGRPGGDGGTLGSAGQTGQTSVSDYPEGVHAGGSGGAAGNYIVGQSYATWTTTGTRLGGAS